MGIVLFAVAGAIGGLIGTGAQRLLGMAMRSEGVKTSFWGPAIGVSAAIALTNMVLANL